MSVENQKFLDSVSGCIICFWIWKRRNRKWTKRQFSIRIYFRLIRASRLKGHELIVNKNYGKRGRSKKVNLQNAEVTKMLDTKNAAKWPLTTQNCFDGKKQVVKGHFTSVWTDSQYETLVRWGLLLLLGTARFVTAVYWYKSPQRGCNVIKLACHCEPVRRLVWQSPTT